MAAGAVILAGFGLAVPGVVDVDAAAEAAGHAVAFGLASLRVPLEAGDVVGAFAPLTGLAVTLWGLASGVRRLAPRWPGPRSFQAAVVGLAFAAVSAGAALLAGEVSGVNPSIPAAAERGLVWGAAGTWLGTLPRRGRARRALPGPIAPGLVGAAVAVGLAAAWFLVAAVVQLAGSPARVFGGGILLAAAVAPNVAVALVSVALGAPVDAVLEGTALAEPVSESLSLWRWNGGAAPRPVMLLVLAPAAGAVLAGRAAATATPADAVALRGLRNGAVTGAALVAGGWAGSLGATAAAGAETVSVRLGLPGLLVFGLALVWSLAGAWAGSRWRVAQDASGGETGSEARAAEDTGTASGPGGRSL